jgi:hypothetical protein
MIDPKKLKLIQDLVLDLEFDYQRMSRSGQQIYDELSEALGLDPVEKPNNNFCHIGD